MQIRLMGIKKECEILKDCFKTALSRLDSGYSISDLYPNRGATNMHRVYINLDLKIIEPLKRDKKTVFEFTQPLVEGHASEQTDVVNKLPNVPVHFDEGHKQYKGGK